VLVLLAAVAAVVLIGSDLRPHRQAPVAAVRRQPLPPAYALAQPRSVLATGTAAIAVRGKRMLVARTVDEGSIVKLVVRDSSLRGGPGTRRAIRLRVGPTVSVAAGQAGFYVRSRGVTWRLAGGQLRRVRPARLPGPVEARLAGVSGLGRVWGNDRRHLVASDPGGGHRVRIAVGPSRLSRLAGFEPVTGAPVVAAGSVWVMQSASPDGSLGAYLQRVHPGGGAQGRPVALGEGIPVLAAVAGGRIWVVTNPERLRPLVWQVDPLTARVLGRPQRLPAGLLPTAAYGNGRALWLASNDPADGRLIRYRVVAGSG
jgi:hypothetical protein